MLTARRAGFNPRGASAPPPYGGQPWGAFHAIRTSAASAVG